MLVPVVYHSFIQSKVKTYLINGTAVAAGKTLTREDNSRALVMATASEERNFWLIACHHQRFYSRLTSLVACTIVNQTEDGGSGCLTHVTTGLTNDLLKGLHHGILHAKVGGFGPGDEF